MTLCRESGEIYISNSNARKQTVGFAYQSATKKMYAISERFVPVYTKSLDKWRFLYKEFITFALNREVING